MYDPYFKEVYSNQRAKGKTYNDALGVIMNKLTRVIYGMLTNKEAYDSSKPKTKKKQTSRRRSANREVGKRNRRL
ncbi:MAG: hypothetical protein IPK35_12065 [Saprospiraceae bacterium]|nr:hypothetical protein [Saprospiraceae bacterium]